MQILIVMYADMDFFYKKMKQYSSNFSDMHFWSLLFIPVCKYQTLRKGPENAIQMTRLNMATIGTSFTIFINESKNTSQNANTDQYTTCGN